jgi:hypothetical protein
VTAWLGAFQRWQELAFGSGNGGASAPAASPPSVGVRDAIEQGNLRFKSLEGKLVGLVRDVNQGHRSVGRYQTHSDAPAILAAGGLSKDGERPGSEAG